jgi:hypothetical protein
MFERFSPAGRRVVHLAGSEARVLRQVRVGTEHLLLALAGGNFGSPSETLRDFGITRPTLIDQVVRSGSLSPARLTNEDARALETIGIDLGDVRAQAEAAFGPGALEWDPPACKTGRIDPAVLSFADETKMVFEHSLEEAGRLCRESAGPEHVLLAILRHPHILAVRLLRRLGPSRAAVRDRLLARLGLSA